jgi:digeranylgeranylglycerophospholipid reductase
MLPAKCDILIVGAGPAGSCAAISAARGGAHTVLIDAKIRIGEQPHCGEFVPEQLLTEFTFVDVPVLQTVRVMETRVRTANESMFAGNNLSPASKHTIRKSETPSGGFVIDRVRFDRDLAREAAASGTTVVCSSRLVRMDGNSWIVRHGDQDISIAPKFTVAADGAVSRVAAALGLPSAAVITGIQMEVPLRQPLDRTLIFLDKSFIGGYGWLFPKGKVANVGLGVIPGKDIHPPGLLDRFVKILSEADLIKQGCLARSGGLIPVSGLRTNLVSGNTLFCGDAAGLTHPISGAGIPQAIFSGTLAGAALVAALKSGDSKPLAEYENEVRGRYQGILDHALAKRLVMMARWNDPDFENTCDETWIGFKGYRKRVRVPHAKGSHD